MMALSKAMLNTTYTVNCVNTDYEDIREFLFTLGCYPGEKITIISKLASNYIINIKDARYSIDEDLADAIMV
ncbi:MAG: ferrous iron transport protein A [Desulfosporosinus sp.]|nr:FeoA family protein [Desulfosporosinus sp.]MBC2728426.1 ferrous iron transport protein A [Desulfosporosinus sp.]